MQLALDISQILYLFISNAARSRQRIFRCSLECQINVNLVFTDYLANPTLKSLNYLLQQYRKKDLDPFISHILIIPCFKHIVIFIE